MQPSDRVALYTLGRTIRVLHGFSSDTGVEELDAWLNEVNQNRGEFYTRGRVRTTLEAREVIAQHMARIPGRKNPIWVSAGFPFSIGLDNLGPATGER